MLRYVPLPTTTSPRPSFSLILSPVVYVTFALPLPFPEVKSSVNSEGVIVGISEGTRSVEDSNPDPGVASMRITWESPKWDPI